MSATGVTKGRSKTTSREAILVASRRAIAERGPEKLTLSAVAAAAGVSRPTLYRWFPTKGDLLAGITEYEKEQFAVALSAAIEAEPSAAQRLDAILRLLVSYLDASIGTRSIQVDPAYALQSLAVTLDPQSKVLATLAAEALAHVPAVEAGTLTPQQAAEMFLRLAYSHYLMPHPQPEVVLAALRAFAGLLEPCLETR